MIKNNSLYALIACIWLLPFASVQFLPFGIPLYPLEIGLLVSSPFWFTGKVINVFKAPASRKVAWFAAALLGGLLISYIVHPKTPAGLGQIKSFFFMPVVFWFGVTPILGDPRHRRRVLWHLRQMFLLAAISALISGFLYGLTYDHRLNAWFDSPNLLAIFLVPGVILWGIHVFSGEKIRIADMSSWVIVSGTLFLTQSYGALGAVFIALVSFLWISRGYLSWKRLFLKVTIISLLLIVGCTFWSGEEEVKKWNSLVHVDGRSSLSSREMIWHSAIRMIQDSPFTGIGPGRFQSVYLEYQRFYPPYLEWAVPHPHNLFLALWLSSGIIGVSASIGLCVFLFCSLREIPRKKERALMTALFLGVFVSGLSDVPYFRAEFCFIFWLELALFSGIFLKENQNSIR